MKTKLISYLLVFFQLSIITLIVGLEPPFCENKYLLGVELFGILLVIYAIWSMKRGNFNITPVPKEEAVLRTTGFYAIVRHPMYLSTMITLLPLIINYFSIYRLFLFIGLSIVLILKLNFEEKLLIKQFEGYKDYQTKTWKLFPFLY